MTRILCSAILVLLLLATALWADPSPLSPLDGSVYTEGDWILIEPESSINNRACGTGFWNSDIPERMVALGSAPESPVNSGYICYDLTAELVRLNLPGQYGVFRSCICQAVIGTCTGESSLNTITVLPAACPRALPTPTPAPPGAPVPKVDFQCFAPGWGSEQILTLDNSFNKVGNLVIINMGDADLVLLDLFPAMEFDSYEIRLVDFVPYTVVRPGHKHYIRTEAKVLNPEVLRLTYHDNYIFALQTNDPAKPLVTTELRIIRVLGTISEKPPEWGIVQDPPPNGGTPACADLNGDGQIDASDVIETLIEE